MSNKAYYAIEKQGGAWNMSDLPLGAGVSLHLRAHLMEMSSGRVESQLLEQVHDAVWFQMVVE